MNYHEQPAETPSGTSETLANECPSPCPCCDARARLRAISYDRAEHSPAAIHCVSPDRRDYNPDEICALVRACVIECFAAVYPRNDPEQFRRAIDRATEKAVRPAAEVP